MRVVAEKARCSYAIKSRCVGPVHSLVDTGAKDMHIPLLMTELYLQPRL